MRMLVFSTDNLRRPSTHQSKKRHNWHRHSISRLKDRRPDNHIHSQRDLVLSEVEDEIMPLPAR